MFSFSLKQTHHAALVSEKLKQINKNDVAVINL